MKDAGSEHDHMSHHPMPHGLDFDQDLDFDHDLDHDFDHDHNFDHDHDLEDQPCPGCQSRRAAAEADALVVTYEYEGLKIRMRGDKTLVGITIPPELAREKCLKHLEATLRKGLNRARVHTDYQASNLFSQVTGSAKIYEDMPTLPEGKEIDARFMTAPELVAGVRDVMKKKGWKLADLAEHTWLDAQLLEELLMGIYSPMGSLKGNTTTLADVIDLAVPLARALRVPPEEIWQRGVLRVQAHQRMKRRQIKRMLKGIHNRGRKNSRRAPKLKLALGNLDRTGIITEAELGLIIREENLIEAMRGQEAWMEVPETDGIDVENLGPLLGPSGQVVLEAISQDNLKALMELDRRAYREPQSITDEEIEWARTLLQRPKLPLRAPRT